MYQTNQAVSLVVRRLCVASYHRPHSCCASQLRCSYVQDPREIQIKPNNKASVVTHLQVWGLYGGLRKYNLANANSYIFPNKPMAFD